MAATSEFSAALNQVCAEKGISADAVLETIKAALISAFRKDNHTVPSAELRAEIDPETGEAKIFNGEINVTPAGFGRIASQTAKQVLLQRLREAEKEAVMAEYRQKVGSIVSGHIFRTEKGLVIFDLGRTQGIMPLSEQLPSEHYQINQRFKVLVKEIRDGGELSRGPEIIVSRTDPRFVEELFSLEVPELTSGVVSVKGIAREAGERTKIAVASKEEKIDPVGSCVGQKGVRVQAVIAELGNEKIDIIQYDEDIKKYIANSLSPAKVRETTLNKKKKEAKVTVEEDQLSLAIGKGGQNVRLAAKLTGWRLDINGPVKHYNPLTEPLKLPMVEEAVAGGEIATVFGPRLGGLLTAGGINDLAELANQTDEALLALKGVGPKALTEIREKLTAVESTTNDRPELPNQNGEVGS